MNYLVILRSRWSDVKWHEMIATFLKDENPLNISSQPAESLMTHNVIDNDNVSTAPDISRSLFLQITHERHTQLAREVEVWVYFLRSKCDQKFIFQVVVLCTITCYIVPRYIVSL